MNTTVLKIRMQSHTVECSLCGIETPWQWSVPVYNGDVVSNDFPDWMYERHGGNQSVCEACFNKHAAGQIPTCDAIYLRQGDLMHGAGI